MSHCCCRDGLEEQPNDVTMTLQGVHVACTRDASIRLIAAAPQLHRSTGPQLHSSMIPYSDSANNAHVVLLVLHTAVIKTNQI